MLQAMKKRNANSLDEFSSFGSVLRSPESTYTRLSATSALAGTGRWLWPVLVRFMFQCDEVLSYRLRSKPVSQIPGISFTDAVVHCKVWKSGIYIYLSQSLLEISRSCPRRLTWCCPRRTHLSWTSIISKTSWLVMSGLAWWYIQCFTKHVSTPFKFRTRLVFYILRFRRYKTMKCIVEVIILCQIHARCCSYNSNNSSAFWNNWIALKPFAVPRRKLIDFWYPLLYIYGLLFFSLPILSEIGPRNATLRSFPYCDPSTLNRPHRLYVC